MNAILYVRLLFYASLCKLHFSILLLLHIKQNFNFVLFFYNKKNMKRLFPPTLNNPSKPHFLAGCIFNFRKLNFLFQNERLNECNEQVPQVSGQGGSLIYMGAYLEADLIIRLFGISFCSISCGYCRSINGTILGNDESMASVVQLQPVEDGATCDDWTCQAGKPMQVGRQQLSNRILQKWIICIQEMYQ